MSKIRIALVIVGFLLLLIHISLIVMESPLYGCSSTGEKECKICIDDDGKQNPCNCEDIKDCKGSNKFIIPLVLVFLAIVNFMIKE